MIPPGGRACISRRNAVFSFGRDIDFTYGPLGFLSAPGAYYSSTLFVSFAFVLAAQVALCFLILQGARRSFPAPLAVVLAYVAAALPVPVSDVPLIVLFLWAVVALKDPAARHARVFVPVAGALAGAEFLLKMNVGIAALAIVAVVGLALRPGGPRSLLVAAGSFAAALVVLWIATGNDVAGLWTWLQISRDIVSGYSQGLAFELPGVEWQYAAAAVLAAVIGELVWRQPLGYGRPQRLALRAGILLLGLYYWKECFVRHDLRPVWFFAVGSIVLLSFAWRGPARWVAVTAILAAVGAVLYSFNVSAQAYFKPRATAGVALTELRQVVSSGRRHALISSARHTLQEAEGLDPATLRALGAHTVDVDPYEAAVAWAYDLRWRPVPVFQLYGAYTTRLDDIDARALSAARAPERILRQNLPVRLDGGTPELEAPGYFLALICHYEELRATDRWQVLARVSNRCGKPALVGSVDAVSGQQINVPPARAPDELVFARIRLRITPIQRLIGVLYKPPTPSIFLNGDATPHRLVFGTAHDPIVMRMPATAGFSQQYADTPTSTFAVHALTQKLHVDFFSIRVSEAKRRASGAGRAPLPAYRLVRVGRNEVIAAGGKRIPIVKGAQGGSLDTAAAHGESVTLSGWSADPTQARLSDEVLVFADRKLVALTHDSIHRADVASFFHKPVLARSGFQLQLARSLLSSGSTHLRVRLFSIFGNKAAEVHYPAGYQWLK